MQDTRMLAYAETDRLQAVAIPYGGGELSLTVVLPRATDGLATVEADLAAGGWGRIASQLQGHAFRRVEIHLPKFSLETSLGLNSALTSLGLVAAFGDDADFSGMARSPIKISQAVHKTFMGLDEKGTEAAAATAIVFVPTAAVRPVASPVLFRADHPFLFTIRDNRSGLILFLGRFSGPPA
jgi:serpin B